MRKFLIPLAAAASTVALAAPAAAQWYPQPQPQAYAYGYQNPYQQPYGYQNTYQQPYGYQNPYQQPYGYQNQYQQPYGYAYGYRSPYQQPYGNAYGYNAHANLGQARALKVRIDRIQRDIARLAQYRMISRYEYQNLIRDSRDIERHFYRNARDGRGLTVNELYVIQNQVARLEHKIARDVRDGRQWGYRW